MRFKSSISLFVLKNNVNNYWAGDEWISCYKHQKILKFKSEQYALEYLDVLYSQFNYWKNNLNIEVKNICKLPYNLNIE